VKGKLFRPMLALIDCRRGRYTCKNNMTKLGQLQLYRCQSTISFSVYSMSRYSAFINSSATGLGIT